MFRRIKSGLVVIVCVALFLSHWNVTGFALAQSPVAPPDAAGAADEVLGEPHPPAQLQQQGDGGQDIPQQPDMPSPADLTLQDDPTLQLAEGDELPAASSQLAETTFRVVFDAGVFYNYDNPPQEHHRWVAEYRQGERIPLPQVESMSGYVAYWYIEVDGIETQQWDFDQDVVVSDMILKAKPQRSIPVHYYLPYSVQNTSQYTSYELLPGDHLQQPAQPVVQGQVFVRWLMDIEGVDGGIGFGPADFERSFTAQDFDRVFQVNMFPEVGFLVEFEAAGGTPVPPAQPVAMRYSWPEFTYFLAEQPPAPQRDGYVFDGWYTQAGKQWNFEEDVVRDHMTLTASWTAAVPSQSSYTVFHRDKQTDAALHQPVIQLATVGQVVQGEAQQIAIAGYRFDSVSSSQLTVQQDAASNQLVVYYHKQESGQGGEQPAPPNGGTRPPQGRPHDRPRPGGEQPADELAAQTLPQQVTIADTLVPLSHLRPEQPGAVGTGQTAAKLSVQQDTQLLAPVTEIPEEHFIPDDPVPLAPLPVPPSRHRWPQLLVCGGLGGGAALWFLILAKKRRREQQ